MRILILGSLTIDIIGGEERPGGPALFCGMACEALGIEYYCVGCRPRDYRWEIPEGDFVVGEGPIFEHRYVGDRRFSRLIKLPEKIGVAPPINKFDLAIVSPVFGEYETHVIKRILELGVPTAIDIQGFVRDIDYKGRIISRYVPDELYDVLEDAVLVHMSDEEMPMVRKLPSGATLSITYGSRGSSIIRGDESHFVPAFQISGDPTGAGDFFTCVLAVKILELGDPIEAAVYATVATSLFIESKIGRRLGEIRLISDFSEDLRMRMHIIRMRMERK